MFKRIILEDWQTVVPYLCFALIGGAFLLIVIRAIRMKKNDVDHLSNLPLQDDKTLLEDQSTDEADQKTDQDS